MKLILFSFLLGANYPAQGDQNEMDKIIYFLLETNWIMVKPLESGPSYVFDLVNELKSDSKFMALLEKERTEPSSRYNLFLRHQEAKAIQQKAQRKYINRYDEMSFNKEFSPFKEELEALHHENLRLLEIEKEILKKMESTHSEAANFIMIQMQNRLKKLFSLGSR